MRGIKLLNRCETTNQLVRTNVRRKLRNTVLRSYYRFFDAFLAIGTRNRQFYESVGVPSKKIFLAPYTVDNRRFISASAITSSQRSAIRQRFSLSVTVPVVLYASKLIERKHPDHVLRAAAALRQEGLEFQVLIVGTGAAEQGLKELARNLSLDNVVFAGFLNQSELPPVFAATDVFVLPSENEPWGLIVNEVMCAGRPVVASNSVGCAVDLIENGKNGYVIQPGNIDALKDALRMLIRDEKLRADMGRASQKRISSWDYEACARGVRSAVHFACDGPTSVRLGGLR
jgi:glycosyltransferase involved in cell wall biosynthesis